MKLNEINKNMKQRANLLSKFEFSDSCLRSLPSGKYQDIVTLKDNVFESYLCRFLEFLYFLPCLLADKLSAFNKSMNKT